MSNLGKAIYMAGFALLFVVAATTSIYLYGTLNSYLETSTGLINVEKRAENALGNDTENYRKITRSEIYITLYNMEQMHVKKITVKDDSSNSYEYTSEEMNEIQAGATGLGFPSFLDFLERNPNAEFTYSSTPIYEADDFVGYDVTYDMK